MSDTSREEIARLGHSFVRDGTVVLTHGYSRCAISLLLKAAETKVRGARSHASRRWGPGRRRRAPTRVLLRRVTPRCAR